MELARNVQLIKRLLVMERDVMYQYVEQERRYYLTQLVTHAPTSKNQTGVDWNVNSQLAAKERSRPP